MRGLRRRDALLVAVLPSLRGQELRSFWARFDAAAPLSMRLGLGLAAWLVVELLPRILGRVRPLGALDPAAQDAAIQRAARWPLFGELLELAKLVACLARFDEAA